MRDQDGFHLLVRRNVTAASDTVKSVVETTVDHSKKTVKTKTKNPFKKGSWKSWLWKNLRKYNPGRWIRNFHNINCQNFIIWRETEDSDYQVMASNVKLPKSFVGELKSSDRSHIMISVGDQMYASITPKAYNRLLKVEKIAIYFTMDAHFDGDDENVSILDEYHTIDNINDLLSYLNYRRQGVYGVYELQAKCSGYTDYFYNYKILVYFRNGTCKSYKGDMNEFLKDFDLYQL